MQAKRPKKDPKRHERLAAALRANLKRRKAKDRAESPQKALKPPRP
jgi:hypothetical protein